VSDMLLIIDCASQAVLTVILWFIGYYLLEKDYQRIKQEKEESKY